MMIDIEYRYLDTYCLTTDHCSESTAPGVNELYNDSWSADQEQYSELCALKRHKIFGSQVDWIELA